MQTAKASIKHSGRSVSRGFDSVCAERALNFSVRETAPRVQSQMRGRKNRVFHRFAGSFAIGILLIGCGCGYRVRGSAGTLPSGMQSLGIPTFQNLTGQYKIEQIISRAVLQEFSLRAKADVNSSSTGVDSVLLGEIRNVSSVPVTFDSPTSDSQTYGSAYLVTVQIGVKLMRVKDSAILWQNENFLFRERYVLNASVRDFFSEENPALGRLARSFAASLASTILDRTSP